MRDTDHHHSNRYDRYESGRGGGGASSMAPPPGLPGTAGPPMHYRDYRGSRDHHPMNEYGNNRNMGGNPPHYSRYPPRGGSSSTQLPQVVVHPHAHIIIMVHRLEVLRGHLHTTIMGHRVLTMEVLQVHHLRIIMVVHQGVAALLITMYRLITWSLHIIMVVVGPPHLLPPPQAPPRYENKKDKFPNYLHHITPEDDPLATRTLFAGNLEVNITDEELRRIFGRYGTVEDIDIKRPPPGTGNAYAFVRFVNLDMAARAKSELSGQYIGKFQCKIGYGKVNPTTKMWIGGLGDWTTSSQLEREFDRFGSIKKIEWIKGEPYAYITFETIDAAQAAVKDMRGYPLGGTEKRIRTDFADAASPPIGSHLHNPPGLGKREYDTRERGVLIAEVEAMLVEMLQVLVRKFNPIKQLSLYDMSGCGSESGRNDSNNVQTRGPGSTHSGGTDLGCTSPGQSDNESVKSSNLGLGNIKSIHDIPRKVGVSWNGALILKNSSFPTKLYLTEGDFDGIDLLMKDEESKNQLRITQRLRLDQSKLDDVLKRISTSSHHGVFLALPCSSTTASSSPTRGTQDEDSQNSSTALQSRPLRNLVSYLKQKEAAGVISLAVAKDPNTTGVLYAFPPCGFSFELLKKQCPGINESESNGGGKDENHLVIVVIRGGNV
ncbi:putative RNA-binding protein 15B [Orchesella cincta]|uniref:Putative RNA-binding protein 15B n=1 Tax=Orchesella cincta TaxID=48709 RepID=A0A1D2MJP5_ORCCI|nr:putative RNA-binding protein 15B [Orchesella cincta]